MITAILAVCSVFTMLVALEARRDADACVAFSVVSILLFMVTVCRIVFL